MSFSKGALFVNLKPHEAHCDISKTSLDTNQSGTSLKVIKSVQWHTGQFDIENDADNFL